MNYSKDFEIEVGQGILREVFLEFGFDGLIPKKPCLIQRFGHRNHLGLESK